MFALLLATSTSAKRVSRTCKVKTDWLILPSMRSVIGQIFATHPCAATHFSDRDPTSLDKMDPLVCNVIYSSLVNLISMFCLLQYYFSRDMFLRILYLLNY